MKVQKCSLCGTAIYGAAAYGNHKYCNECADNIKKYGYEEAEKRIKKWKKMFAAHLDYCFSVWPRLR